MNQNKPLYSIEAERSVLGSILLEPSLLEPISEALTSDLFYRPEHRIIFETFSSLSASGEPVDVVTANELLNKNNLQDEMGGLPYLIELVEETPSQTNAMSYVAIVKERARLREFANVASQMTGQARERDGMNSAEMIEEAERLLSQISKDENKEGGFESIGSILNSAIEDIDDRYQNGETVTGISTGLDDLDEMTGGLQDTDLLVLAGRPASGKSTCAMNMAESAAINEGKAVAVFSLEMPKNQLANRMIASIGRIEQTKIKTGKLEQHDFDKMMGAFKKMKDSKLFIDDAAGVSPSYIRNKLKKMEREHGKVDLVVIDYLQLMQIPGFKEGRTNEVSEISRALKAIAKEFKCPVIALSQLNRGLEQRPNKRPNNSDLRESGAIEQDADIIIFVYRDEVYNPDTADKGIAELIIGKQRNGPVGTCRTAFLGHFARFENLAKGYNDY